MATATNSRRDLYATSEPRPKDSAKRRNVSPPKHTQSHKSHKKAKKELSAQEISLLTYQSISLLLDAARMLDEAERKATAKTFPKASVTKSAVKTQAKQPTPSTSGLSPAHSANGRATARSPAKYATDAPSTSSSSSSLASAALLTVEPTSSVASASIRSPKAASVAPVAASTPAPPPAPVTPLAPLSITVPPTATVSLLSPTMPILRPVIHPAPAETLVPLAPRQVASLPIPAELADIAVPVAPRSVSSVPRSVKTPKAPRQPKTVVKKKAKTAELNAAEMALEQNLGYPDECRTRIPDAVRRYWTKMENKRRETSGGFFDGDFYWKHAL